LTQRIASVPRPVKWTTPPADVLLELLREMLQRAPDDRPGGGVAEGAEAAAVHHSLAPELDADVADQVDVLQASLAVLDARDQLEEPVGADPARDALAARLVLVELGDPD